MTRLALVLVIGLVMALPGGVASAGNGCSVKAVAGQWLFATGIGRQMLGAPFPPDKDITALGTMNINRDGSLSRTLDVNVEDFGFIQGSVYEGSLTVNPDGTGTISFVTSVGSVRTDSIAVVSRKEMIGMSQDPANLWTYQVRRIAANLRRDNHDD